jgi:hypothetical protein
MVGIFYVEGFVKVEFMKMLDENKNLLQDIRNFQVNNTLTEQFFG